MVCNMEKEYDFSKAKRGLFYKKDMKINLPVYLDEEVMAFVSEIANKKNLDISSIVNQLLRNNMNISKL